MANDAAHSTSVRNFTVRTVAVLLVLIAIGVSGIFAYSGTYGINVVLRGTITFWVSVSANDPRLSNGMRLALKQDLTGSPGSFSWQNVGTGFDVAELPVLAEGKEVDRILLARIDPHQYHFVTRNAPAGNVDLQGWMRHLKAALVINGSYFSRYGTPATPFLSDGHLLGPVDYDAQQGAFVASKNGASIHDLSHESWQAAFRGANNALVSYPLLVSGDATDHLIKHTHWLANRSFVGQDRSGRIVLGTTQDAFFSLARLSAFLRASPLGLTRALNLDGGPVACQGIFVEHYRRSFCGKWEMQDRNGTLKLLTWLHGTWALPVVLAAIPNRGP